MSLSFNQAKEMVRTLVREKGFPTGKKALTQKLLWAYSELGEATNAYKKGKPWEEVVEELIDVFFYILNFIDIVEQEYNIYLNLDKIFLKKWAKNMKRKDQYGQRRDIIRKDWKK